MTTNAPIAIDTLQTEREQLLSFALDAMTKHGLDEVWQITIAFNKIDNTITFSKGEAEDGASDIVIGLYPGRDGRRFEVGTQAYRHTSFRSNMTWESATSRFWELINQHKD